MGENISENNNTLELKSIADIKDKEFIIPSFQRGYRWEPVQVITLLEDIKEYIEKADKIKTFMCLQPVVFYKNKDNKLIVIDGQQRLTTIAIINYFLKNSNSLNNNDIDNIYIIRYEKYKCSDSPDKSLYQILSKVSEQINYNYNEDNNLYETALKIYNIEENHQRVFNFLDEYYIILSYLVLKHYFTQNESDIENFNNLFDSNLDSYSIKFIWYDVTGEVADKEQKAIDIFTRLNIGKILLTDAELIKALFLKKDNFKDSELNKKLHIAYKWDEIEKTLNNDSFWYFISNDKNKPKKDRIELILELAANIKNDGQHNLFRDYENKLKHKDELDTHWQAIEECFMTLKEWYNDNEIYHYIGYLICSRKQIEYIYNIRNNNNDNHITNISKQVLFDITKYNNPDISDTDIDVHINNIINNIDNIISNIENYNYYDKDKKDIKNILLFSNIYATILQNNIRNSKNNTNNIILNRFPFDLYVKENWDVEHIAPQTENPLKNKEERIIWFKDSYNYLNKIDFSNINDDEIKNNLAEEHIKKIIENEDNKNINNIIFNNEKWNIVYNYILETAIEKSKNINLEDEEHCLGNLVLLPGDINRSYKNALFGVKRKHIIDDETKKSRFIPIITKHVFLKYYSDNTDNLWTKQDAIQFKNKIISNLKSFFKQFSKKEGSQNEHK